MHRLAQQRSVMSEAMLPFAKYLHERCQYFKRREHAVIGHPTLWERSIAT